MKKIPAFLFQTAYKLAHASLVVFAFIFRPAVRGVNVAIWKNNKLLLVKNSYRKKYTLPGGYVRIGENPKTAAVRELNEEVGLISYPNQLKHFRQYKFTAFYKRETVDIYEMTVGNEAEIAIDNQEVVWAGFMPPEKALSRQLCIPAKKYLEYVSEMIEG
jgi:8-oxo-dGTP diphosphatase